MKDVIATVAFKLRCIQYPAVRRADEIPLPAVRPLERFVIAACRDDASMALECVPEHRLVGNAFGARVEARWQVLHGLFPPPMRPQRMETSSVAPLAAGNLLRIVCSVAAS